MALQIRRGTNAERLGITLVEGEIAYVTDFELVTVEVTSINVSTNTLTTTVSHGLAVNDQIRFLSLSANGLVNNTVYWVKTVPDANNFTLSSTQGGATFDITGTTGTVSLTFAVGPSDALGTPYGYSISPIYVGDGITAGGNPAGSSILDDLYDVEIGVYGNVGQYGKALNQGQLLTYNEESLKWENNNTIKATAVGEVIDHVRTATAADAATTLRSALFLTKEITDDTTGADNGGPAITFLSRGTDSGNDASMIQIGAYNNTGGAHDFVVKTSTDNFSTTATEQFKVGPTRTSIHDGVLYVDNTNNRVGINNTSPTHDLTVNGTGFITTSLTVDGISIGDATSTTITTTAGNLTLDSSGGTTNINDDVVVSGDLTVTGNDIKKSGGTTVITFSGTNLTTLAGDLVVGGNTIQSSSANAIELSGANATIQGNLQVDGGTLASGTSTFNLANTTATTVNFAGAATALTMGATTGTTTVRNDLQVNSNATITGNLTVNGTTTNIDTVNLVIEDNLITLNKNQTGTPSSSMTSGIEIERGDGVNTSWIWEENNKWWRPEGDFDKQNVWAGNTLIAGTILATNGNQIIFNNEDGTDANCDLTVKRGSGETYDAYVRWNATADRWQFSNGDNTFNNMVIQLDDLSDVTTSSPAKGAFLYHDSTEWVNGSRIEFDSTVNRLQLVNNATGTTGALELLKNTGTDIADGDAVSQLFGIINTTPTKTFTHRLWAEYDSSGNHIFKIQNDSTSSFATGSTTILDSLSISKTAAEYQSDYQTFNSGSGNTTYLTLNGDGSQVYTDFTIGNASTDNLTITSQVNGNIAFKATNTWTGITGTNGTNDYWKIGGYASGTNAGELIIATGDDQSEPIVFRQYSGNFDVGGYRQTVIMDASGNANFCGQIDTIGDVTVGGELYVEGNNIYLNSNHGGTPTADVGITVERGSSTDATFKWIESNDFWSTNYSLFASSQVIGGTSIGTNGNDIYFNNDDTGSGSDSTLTVKRGSNPDVAFKWDEATDRWSTTTDGSTYIDLPNQALDTTSDVSFGGITLDSRSTFNTGATTTTSTAAFTLDETNRNAIKLMVYIEQGTDSHALEILIMRTSASAMMTTYGEMYTTSPLATFTADQSGGNIRVRCTPTSATSTTFSVVRYSLT